MVMKLVEFFAPTHFATFENVILRNEGEEKILCDGPSKIINSQILIFAKRAAKFEYFASYFISLMLFDIFYRNYHVQIEIVWQV